MTQADSVYSTPPTNTPVDPTRRRFLTVAAVASAVSAGTLAAAAAMDPSIPAAAAKLAAQTLDAELIELGARFEPLVDRYYVAHRRWSRLLAQAHADQEAEFGPPAERNYQDTPEIRAAWSERCDRSALNEADDRLSAIGIEREPIQFAIDALPVTSIEGLRAKALVAFFNVSPLCAGDTEYHFQDELAFQQLFTAVAEFCGLKDKVAATGYELPDLPEMVEDAPDDDSDDEGEEA
jgi:hypothetical protein